MPHQENRLKLMLPASDVLRSFCGATWEDLNPFEILIAQQKKNDRVIYSIKEIEPEIRSKIRAIQKNYKEYLDQAWLLEVKAQNGIAQKDFDIAIKKYFEWLLLLYQYQKNRKVRIHKGYVLFRLGLTYYRQNKMKEALEYILQAFIEDVVSSRDLSQIMETHSFRMLTQLGVGLDFLEKLKTGVLKEKAEGRNADSPDSLGKKFLSDEKVSTPKKIAYIEKEKLVIVEALLGRKTIEELPGNYDKRVFIGGSYANSHLNTLRELAKYVDELGYYPVIAIDYDPPRDDKNQELLNVHDFDVLLIHVCNYAIFELSKPAGQYNEIEWAIRFLKKKTFGICRLAKKSDVSTLIRDLFGEIRENIFYYSSTGSMKDYIRSRLQKT